MLRGIESGLGSFRSGREQARGGGGILLKGSPGSLEAALPHRDFRGSGLAGEETDADGIQSCGFVRMRAQHPVGEKAGRLDVGGTVEGRQRVHRGIRPQRIHLADLSFRGVKKLGGTHDAPPEGVEAATMQISATALGVGLFPEGRLVPDPGGLVGIDRRPAESAIEQAGGGEGLVADHPRGHAEARPAGEKPVRRIAFEV